MLPTYPDLNSKRPGLASDGAHNGSANFRNNRVGGATKPVNSGAYHFDQLKTSATGPDKAPERKLKLSLNNIQEAFDEKVTDLEGQLASWQKTSARLEKKVDDLEAFLSELQGSLDISKRNAAELGEKHSVLLDSQNQLVNKYNQLRRYAIQLESFKKNIISLSGSSPVSIDANMIEQSLAIEDEKLVAKDNHLDLRRPNLNSMGGGRSNNYFNHSPPSRKFGGSSSGGAYDWNEDYPPVPETKETYRPQSNASSTRATTYQRPLSSHNNKTDTFEEKSHDHQLQPPAATAPQLEDRSGALGLYDRILMGLDAEEFTRFTQAIHEFNAGEAGLQETLEKFRNLIADPTMYREMENLLKQSQSDASFALEVHNNQQQYKHRAPHSRNITDDVLVSDDLADHQGLEEHSAGRRKFSTPSAAGVGR